MGAAAARSEATKATAAPAAQPQPAARHDSTTTTPVGTVPFLRLAPIAAPPLPDAPPRVHAALARDPGTPLPVPVRGAIETSLGVDLGAVRVHQSSAATTLVGDAGARAFAYSSHVFLGAGERATDLRLMAHEVTHVVQQQHAPRVQLSGGGGTADALEAEANQVAATVTAGEPATVQGRASSQPQFLFESVRGAVSSAVSAVSAVAGAVTDVAGAAMGFIGNQARRIPGYDMLALILGRDPITQAAVPRTAVNVIRAVTGMWPGGTLFYDALQRYGLVDRVGGWLETQLLTLAGVAGGIRDALARFIASLGIADVANLGGVWDRARRIFTEPLAAATQLVAGLVVDVLRFIREAVLLPLARLAEGTRGYDLLRLVLGVDPITSERYPRTPENVIGGFMRLIGQEETWRYLQESRAIPRAWAWFQGQFGILRGFVSRVPGLFVEALQTLQVAQLLDLPGAFLRIAGIFGGFYVEYVRWASGAVLQIMLCIFEVLAPGAMPVLRGAATAIRTIVLDPVRFIGHLVRAGLGGFRQFLTNIGTHLLNGLIGWLTGALSGAGLQLPQRWDLRGILSLVLQILGITWQNIRQKLLRHIPEPVLRGLETTFDVLVMLVREGPVAAWQRILEQLQDLRDVVFGAIRNWVIQTIVVQAVSRIASWFTPAGVVVEAVLAIYNTIMFLIERARQIFQVVEAYFSAIAQIAAGNVAAAATRVEQTMARVIPVVISFLARLIGLGGISNTIRNIITRLRAPIDRALDRLVDWIAAQARRLLGSRTGATTAPVRVGEVVAFQAGGQPHRLYVELRGRRATLIVATTPLTVAERLADWTARANTLSTENAAQANAAIARAHDLERLAADQLTAAATGAPGATAATGVTLERRLATELSVLMELFGEDRGSEPARLFEEAHGKTSLQTPFKSSDWESAFGVPPSTARRHLLWGQQHGKVRKTGESTATRYSLLLSEPQLIIMAVEELGSQGRAVLGINPFDATRLASVLGAFTRLVPFATRLADNGAALALRVALTAAAPPRGWLATTDSRQFSFAGTVAPQRHLPEDWNTDSVRWRLYLTAATPSWDTAEANIIARDRLQLTTAISRLAAPAGSTLHTQGLNDWARLRALHIVPDEDYVPGTAYGTLKRDVDHNPAIGQHWFDRGWNSDQNERWILATIATPWSGDGSSAVAGNLTYSLVSYNRSRRNARFKDRWYVGPDFQGRGSSPTEVIAGVPFASRPNRGKS